MNRRDLLLTLPAAAVLSQMPAFVTRAADHRTSVMLMNRIGPSTSDLFIAKADGTDEHPFLQVPGFDYHASVSPGGWPRARC